jgi:hypothetical protein
MASKPAGLGDVKVALKRVQDTFDLPDNRQGIVARFESILGMGGVQKVVVELGHPIKVDRLVKAGEGQGEAKELPDDDLMNAVRNGELVDFPQSIPNQFAYLFQAFYMLGQKRLRPRTFIVHSLDELKKWLQLDAFMDVRELYGVEVIAHPEVPDYTGLLVASNPDESDAGTFALRLTLELPKEKSSEANRGKGAQERNRGQGNGRAPGEVGKPS